MGIQEIVYLIFLLLFIFVIVLQVKSNLKQNGNIEKQNENAKIEVDETMRNNINQLEWETCLEEFEKSAVYFVPATKKCFNRIGGKPSLPLGVKWPLYNGNYMNFVAQIDLSTLPQNNGVLPKGIKGALYFFAFLDGEIQNDVSKKMKVIYSETATDEEFVTPLDFTAKIYKPTYLKAKLIKNDLPAVIEESNANLSANVSLVKNVDTYSSIYAEILSNDLDFNDLQTNVAIKFGGFESWFQANEKPNYDAVKQVEDEALQEVCNQLAYEDYQFLCEIFSQKDKEQEMDFGQDGIIYVYIKKADLLNWDFSNLRFVSQGV